MPSTDSSKSKISTEGRAILITVATESIREGLKNGRALLVDPAAYESELQRERASFVTLMQHDRLRGCIGHLEAHQPLIADVAENAYSAAFRDPRFPAISEGELESLSVEISILTPPQPFTFNSETELLQQLRPGTDGLIIQFGNRRATFLPTVWDSLPDADSFLRNLKIKAGLQADFWSPEIQAWTYQSESIVQ